MRDFEPVRNRTETEGIVRDFDDDNGRISATTLSRYRYSMIEHTEIDWISYAPASIKGWLQTGGEERVRKALAEVAEED